MRDFYLREETYAESMEKTVLPYLSQRRSEGTVSTGEKTFLRFVKYMADAPRGTVVIAHGFTESAEKYHELSYYFLLSGYHVLIPEHRGHGRSYRDIKDAPTLTHIDRFEDYADDFLMFLRGVPDTATGKLCLFAHSMGGAIGLLAMEKEPCLFEKAVLSSPMIAPSTGGVPPILAKAILHAAVIFGKSKKRAFISSPYPGVEKFEDSCKTSKERFAEYEKIKEETPEFQNYSPTYGWAYQSMTVKRKILRRGAPERIRTKLFLAVADNDTTVDRAAEFALARRLPDMQVHIYENAKHEIYGSTDAVAHPYFDDVLNFFES